VAISIPWDVETTRLTISSISTLLAALIGITVKQSLDDQRVRRDAERRSAVTVMDIAHRASELAADLRSPTTPSLELQPRRMALEALHHELILVSLDEYGKPIGRISAQLSQNIYSFTHFCTPRAPDTEKMILLNASIGGAVSEVRQAYIRVPRWRRVQRWFWAKRARAKFRWQNRKRRPPNPRPPGN